MSERLTRKDFMTTAGILLLLLVGLPCMMWVISSYRQEAHKQAVEMNMISIIQRHWTTLEESARIISLSTASTTLSESGWGSYHAPYWDDLIRGSAITISAVDQLKGAMRSACTVLKTDMERRLPNVVMHDHDCSFFFEDRRGLVSGHVDQVYTHPEQVKVKRVNELSTTTTEPVLYRDRRDWLVYVLIQQEPRVALELRLREKDERSY